LTNTSTDLIAKMASSKKRSHEKSVTELKAKPQSRPTKRAKKVPQEDTASVTDSDELDVEPETATFDDSDEDDGGIALDEEEEGGFEGLEDEFDGVENGEGEESKTNGFKKLSLKDSQPGADGLEASGGNYISPDTQLKIIRESKHIG
jgi:hypothetical protein